MGISKDVWRTALQFLYTGVINCPFSSDAARMVELLRACVMYRLPKPLLDFTQLALFNLMPASPPTVALEVFKLVCISGDDIDVQCLQEASVYILLRSAPLLFQAMESTDL